MPVGRPRPPVHELKPIRSFVENVIRRYLPLDASRCKHLDHERSSPGRHVCGHRHGDNGLDRLRSANGEPHVYFLAFLVSGAVSNSSMMTKVDSSVCRAR